MIGQDPGQASGQPDSDGALPATPTREDADDAPSKGEESPREIGGRPGPDPTRYGDWEKNGRCIDF